MEATSKLPSERSDAVTTSYPGAIDAFARPNDGDVVQSSTMDNLMDAIEAIETEVGKTSSPTAGSVRARLTALEGGGGAAAFGGAQCFLTGVSPYLRMLVNTSAASNSQQLEVCGFISPKSFTAAKAVLYVTTGGSGQTSFKVGLYSLDSSGNGTRIAVTADEKTAMQGTGKIELSFLASTAVSAGSAYAIAFYGNGGTQPTIRKATTTGHATLNAGQQPFQSARLAGQTDCPASLTFSGLTVSTDAYYVEIVS